MLVGLDQKMQVSVGKLVPRGRLRSRAPLRELVRDPARPVEGAAVEAVFEVEHVALGEDIVKIHSLVSCLRAARDSRQTLVLTILVGAPVSAFAGDAVTGFVAGVGAGGIVAIRADVAHNWKARAIAVLAVSACVFILLRSTTVIALLLAPVLPFTSIGVADHLSERRREREAQA